MIAVTSAGMEVLETAGLCDPDGAETPAGFQSAPSTGGYDWRSSFASASSKSR